MKEIWQWNAKKNVATRCAQSFRRYPDVLNNPDGRLAQWLDQVAIEPFWAKEWLYNQGWALGPRVLDHPFWFYFHSGRGWVSLEDDKHRYDFTPGTMVLIPAGRQHKLCLRSGIGCKVVSVHFQVLLHGCLPLLSMLGFPVVSAPAAGAPFARASFDLAREFAVQSPGWRSAMRARISDVLLYLVRHRGKIFKPFGTAALDSVALRLLPVLDGVARNFSRPELSVGEMAGWIGVGEAYLRRMFRQSFGTSPVAYLRQCRIDRACVLLVSTKQSIKEIAGNTGFAEAHFFSRTFRSIKGCSPLCYRENVLIERNI